MKAAVLGAGVIGAGWAARFVLHGWPVAVWDPDTRAPERVAAVVEDAAQALQALYDVPLPTRGEMRFCATPADAVDQASWVQESAPEDLARKQAVYRELEGALSPGAVLASSTSGFRPSVLADGCALAAQMLVSHPFNPVYLIPGVEVVPGQATGAGVVEQAVETLTSIGMQPTVVRQEIDAHVADRLLEAVWREALWLVRDGIATTGEIDAVIRSSFGLRWAQMGLFETYRLGGGDGGFAHFLAQFGPALKWPWSRLTDVPELDQGLIDQIVEQSDAQTGTGSTRDMVLKRDRNLVALQRALKSAEAGVGPGLREFEARQTP